MATYTLELTVDGATQMIPLAAVPTSVVLRLWSTTDPVRELVAERVVL